MEDIGEQGGTVPRSFSFGLCRGDAISKASIRDWHARERRRLPGGTKAGRMNIYWLWRRFVVMADMDLASGTCIFVST